MTPSLPLKPNLEQLRKQAKDLRKAHQSGDVSCCDVLRKLNRFAAASDADILAADVPLKEVQFALAMHYGFKGWDDMRQAVGSGSEKAGGKVSLGDIKLQANLMVEDIFCLTVQAVAKLLHGVDIDYQSLHALSTNAYCLAINPGEDCMSWWHHAGRAVASDLIGKRWGLAFRELRIDGLGVKPGMSREQWDQTTKEQMQRFPVLFRQVMADGGIVIVHGGWRGGSGLVPWVHWGIITLAEDGRILGASFNGRNDNPMEYVDNCWSVFPAEPSMSEPQADTEMLARAVHRIRAEGPDFGPEGLAFGLRGMDLWIRQMREVQGFCAGCFEKAPDRAWGDANDPALTLLGGARTVSSYLHKRAGVFGAKAGPYLESVASRYQTIADAIGPFTGKDGLYRQFIGDLDKQKKHADSVLRPIRDEMAKAADELEKALAASRQADTGRGHKGDRR